VTDLEDLLRAHISRSLPTFLDSATLIATPDEQLAGKVCDFALWKIGGNFEKEVEILASLAEGIRNLYVTSSLHVEVCNGGFNQFYFNSSAKFALIAPAAFEYFGAQVLANIVREANSVRASEAKWIRTITRMRTIESFMQSYRYSKLRPLDEQYWGQDESLQSLWIAKIRARPEEFCG
jgi:hypothetical protein